MNNMLSNEDENELPLKFVRETAKLIGIDLEPEEIENGVHQRTSENVILKSVICLAEELIRKALANSIIERRNSGEISRSDILNVLLERKEFSIFLNLGLGKNTTI